MRRLVFALLGITIGAGCGSDVDAEGRYDVDALQQLKLVEEVRIGSIDDPDAGFSSIRNIDVDRDGNVFVLEGQALEIRVYDTAGKLIQRMGGVGSGPGEFRSPGAMGVAGDTVWVSDMSARRTTLFSRTGSLIATLDAQPLTVEVLPDVTLMVQPGPLRPDGRFDSAWRISLPRTTPKDTIRIPRLLFDASGAVIDTLGFEPFTFGIRPEPLSIGGQSVTPVTGPDDASLRTRASGDFVIVDRFLARTSDESAFTLTWLTEREDTLARQSYRYTPRPFDDATVDSLVMGRARLYERLGLDVDAVAAALRDALALPPFQTPISAAHLAADGSVWLAREADFAPEQRWIVIGPDGTPRGEVELDRRARFGWADANVLWVIEVDELDIPWVVKYRIEG